MTLMSETGGIEAKSRDWELRNRELQDLAENKVGIDISGQHYNM